MKVKPPRGGEEERDCLWQMARLSPRGATGNATPWDPDT